MSSSRIHDDTSWPCPNEVIVNIYSKAECKLTVNHIIASKHALSAKDLYCDGIVVEFGPSSQTMMVTGNWCPTAMELELHKAMATRLEEFIYL